MEYRKRIADSVLKEKLQVFGAVLITAIEYGYRRYDG